eukprot:GFYU01014689.1.p1 GENE.GFYU01014689.1~~GFYU01014689.1.p1  ORF type:complete len:280 (+),score=50.22 GFYU01014689.1:71-841(+)
MGSRGTLDENLTLAELSDRFYRGGEHDEVVLRLGNQKMYGVPALATMPGETKRKLLKNVRVLDLSMNYIVTVGKGLVPFSCLRALILGANSLNEFPDLTGLDSLEELYINNNFIAEIPAGALDHTPALRVLDMRQNKLTEFNAIPCPQLRSLSLSNNLITTWRFPSDTSTCGPAFPHLEFAALFGLPISSVDVLTQILGQMPVVKTVLVACTPLWLSDQKLCADTVIKTCPAIQWIDETHQKTFRTDVDDSNAMKE